MNTIINCTLYCIPTVKIINNNVDSKNAILGLRKIAVIMITAGIGKP